MRCITDTSQSADDILSKPHWLDGPVALAADQRDHVLALRGLLACDLLCHCLQKRHNVDYGIARCVGAHGDGTVHACVICVCVEGAGRTAQESSATHRRGAVTAFKVQQR